MSTRLSKDQVNEAINLMTKEFFFGVVGACSCDYDQKELSYVKTPVTIPTGGTYLVSILHIDGPKLDIEQLRLVSDALTDEKPKRKRRVKKEEPNVD